jgi:sigma-B regulation protein RsbU (phosphoserine phosphatase)
MQLSYHIRLRLTRVGLLPASRLALVTWYLLGLDLFLFLLQKLLARLRVSYGHNLGGWVSFLSFVVIVLFVILAIRWLKAKLLWRLRNRLIVTYVFIGVIPVILLLALALGSLYLFAGQFATFIVTTGLESELSSLEAANSAITHELAAGLQHGTSADSAAIAGLRRTDPDWANRRVCVWLDGHIILNSTSSAESVPPPSLPSYLKTSFRGIVRDQGKLFLRAAESMQVGRQTLVVLSSEPVDHRMLESLATNLGEVTLYASGFTLRRVGQTQAVPLSSNPGEGPAVPGQSPPVAGNPPRGVYVLDTKSPTPTLTAGILPPPTRRLDRQVTFATAISVVDWVTGTSPSPAALSVETRVSKLYQRLFASLGDFAPSIEFGLLVAAVGFAVIELAALLIGVRLTRTATSAVAQLYDATRHINRGDFGHRITVKSSDQLATLANSFNSMTTSLEKLIEEQKQKQRLENELVIAQEVQAQLFPKQISQLATLEVFGFCRPARTVSGDYYDFLAMEGEKLLLAVGDVSGKGISAALLMATIHSAVRAYSLEGIPVLREPVAAGAGGSSSMVLGSTFAGAELAPGILLKLLNHQLFESTPMEKYATLFLGIYDGQERKLTYTNGGHLPPIILGVDRSIRKLDRGGTVIGLFDDQDYEEASVQLRRGEIFLAYSDGVTEPENDFGEFGEHRLVDLVQENRDLPLAKISELVTAAVDDWIGGNEQPDDVTLVLARAR